MATITYTIDDSKLEEFKSGFLKSRPVPFDKNGQPIMSENGWIKEWGKLQFIEAYRIGKVLIKQKEATFDKNILV